MEIQDAAKALFMQGFSGQEIAKMLRRSENTVSNWKKKGAWEDLKRKQEVHQQSSEESIRELIDYQLQALKERTALWKENRKEGESPKLIERGEIDALQKLYTTIKKKEQEWENIVMLIRDLTLWLEQRDLALAKKFVAIAPQYINEKRRDD